MLPDAPDGKVRVGAARDLDADARAAEPRRGIKRRAENQVALAASVIVAQNDFLVRCSVKTGLPHVRFFGSQLISHVTPRRQVCVSVPPFDLRCASVSKKT